MRKIVTEIKADTEGKQTMKVAAYCRVSTRRETQLTSLRSQRIHYQVLIAEQPDWEFAGIYYEEGLSGTHKENRPELQRLLADCKMGRIDLVLTKSISRFARNTTDCLEMVRALTGSGVNIYFEKERLYTGEMGSELVLAVLAAIAEFEAGSISENGKWAHIKRCAKGRFRFSRAPYGYLLQDGHLIADPEEAVIVRYIFACVLAGKGTPTIAAELNRRRVPTKRGGSWHPGTLQKMLKNVVYEGDLLLQKSWRDETFRRHPNQGEVDRFYIEGDHEAIITKDVFAAAVRANRQRGREVGNVPSLKSVYTNRYCFTGRLICGACGACFKRQCVRRKDGCHACWVCKNHLKRADSCPMGKLWEESLENSFSTLLNKLSFSQKDLLVPYIRSLEKEAFFSYGENEHPIRRICCRRKSRHSCDCAAQAQMLLTFLAHLQGPVLHFSEDAFEKYVDHVLVRSTETVIYQLKCGLRLEEKV